MSKEKSFEEFLRHNNGHDFWYVDNGDNEGIVSPVEVNHVKVYGGNDPGHSGPWWLGEHFDLTLDNVVDLTKEDDVHDSVASDNDTRYDTKRGLWDESSDDESSDDESSDEEIAYQLPGIQFEDNSSIGSFSVSAYVTRSTNNSEPHQCLECYDNPGYCAECYQWKYRN